MDQPPAAKSRTPIPLIYSGRVRRALQWAELAHRGVSRKSGDHPYLLHLVAVGQLLAAAGVDDDLLCAGYLHDAVEDTEVTLLEIEDEFGRRVATLVGAVTKPTAGTKEERNQQIRDWMSEAPLEVCAVKAADLIANMTDLVLDKQEQGFSHWRELFGSNARGKIGHYLELAAILQARLAEEPNGAFSLLVDTLRERSEQLARLLTDFEAQAPNDIPETTPEKITEKVTETTEETR